MKSWEMVPAAGCATGDPAGCSFGARRQVASMEAGQEDLWQPMAPIVELFELAGWILAEFSSFCDSY